MKPDIGFQPLKFTFGVWIDLQNRTYFGIDFGPLEVIWRMEGYRP